MRHRALLVGWVVGVFATFGLGLSGCSDSGRDGNRGGGGISKEITRPARFEHWSDADWAAVLEAVCTADGLVRYDGLVNNTNGYRDALFRYVGAISQASPDNRADLFPTDGAKLAYWINAYNALCMYGVYQRKLPDAVPYTLFSTDKFRVGGVNVTLEGLEKIKVRSAGDPRVHFALNSMSFSSPPLLNEPYDGSRLGAQFDAQGQRYLSDPRGAQQAGVATVRLSEVFTKFYIQEWKDAYTRRTGRKAPGLIEALLPYAGPASPVQKASEYESMDYDWSLNRAK